MADIDIKLEDAEISLQNNAPAQAGVTSITLSMKGLEGNKQLTMNTNALESKINAVEVIRELIKNLEKSYFPFVE